LISSSAISAPFNMSCPNAEAMPVNGAIRPSFRVSAVGAVGAVAVAAAALACVLALGDAELGAAVAVSLAEMARIWPGC
jgi:hypothetical protein